MEEMKIPPVKGDTFPQLFNLQRNLLKYYTTIEGLPKFPLNLLEKDSQKFIRELIRRITSELCEAHTSLMDLYKACDENAPQQKILGHLKDYNMELADVWHFFLELMLFAGEDENSVVISLENLGNNNPVFQGIISLENSFESWWKISKSIADREGITESTGPAFLAVNDQQAIDNPHLRGGRKVSLELIEAHQVLKFQLIYILNETGNSLKIKDWSQGVPESNLIAFREGIYDSLIALMKYCYFAGQTELGVFHSYYLKNQINIKRIKNGY